MTRAMRSALLLAGGESRRFGSPKALAPFRGRIMASWVADVLVSRAEELIVSVGTADLEGRLRGQLPDATWVRDDRRDRGPIEGFRTGFRIARGEVVLVAPCDAPLLRRELFDVLLASLGEHDAAVPNLAALDPLRAVYRRGPVLHSLAASADVPASPSALVDRLDAALVTETSLRSADPDLSSFLDVNRPADLPTS